MSIEELAKGYYALAVAGFLLLTLGAIWAMSQAWKHRAIPAVQDYLYKILYGIDAGCDYLDAPMRKQAAILQIKEFLGWRRIFVPNTLVSIGLTALVWSIRRAGLPDLHQDPVPQPVAQPPPPPPPVNRQVPPSA